MTQLLPLRDYQADGMAKLYDALRDHQRVAGVLPTGGGKTVMFGHIAAEHVAGDQPRDRRKVLVLSHRDELVTQAAQARAQGPGGNSQPPGAGSSSGARAESLVTKARVFSAVRSAASAWPAPRVATSPTQTVPSRSSRTWS